MFHTKPGHERALHLRFTLRNCTTFWVWSSPDNVLNILLRMGFIYLKNCEILMFLSINLNSSTHLVSLIWFDPLISTTQTQLPFLINSTYLLSLVNAQRLYLWESNFEIYIQFTIERTICHSTVPTETAVNTGSNAVANKNFMIQKNLTYTLDLLCFCSNDCNCSPNEGLYVYACLFLMKTSWTCTLGV